MEASPEMPVDNLPVVYQAPDERRFWTKLRRVVAHIPFAEDLLAGYYCAIDRATPTHVRAILLGAIAYFVLPADAVPDLFAGIGFTDDAAVLAAALTAVGRHLQPRHRAQARGSLERLGR
jgi:uncharacterized membrane protein YkvA (DUF1232 family)